MNTLETTVPGKQTLLDIYKNIGGSEEDLEVEIRTRVPNGNLERVVWNISSPEERKELSEKVLDQVLGKLRLLDLMVDQAEFLITQDKRNEVNVSRIQDLSQDISRKLKEIFPKIGISLSLIDQANFIVLQQQIQDVKELVISVMGNSKN